jgi:acetoin utilization protein AcuB
MHSGSSVTTMLVPSVSEFMSLQTHTIGRAQNLTTAHRLMRAHQVRHLPVLDGGQVVGIVSQRDLHIMETLDDADPDAITVEEAMTQDVCAVAPEAPLDEVAELMLERKLGSVVVMRHGHLEGIFTTVDALYALTRVLQRASAS